MQNESYSKDLEEAARYRDQGIWVMASDAVSPETARFLEAELARSLAQRPMIGQEAGYYTSDVILILNRAHEAVRQR